MLLVIGMATIAMVLTLVATAIATRSLASGRVHGNFEDALAATENGIDEALARSQAAYDANGSDSYLYPNPNNPKDSACTAGQVTWAYSSQPSAATEQAWAKSQLLAIAAVSGCRFHTSQGDYVFFKPSGHMAVYAMGWSPSYGASNSQRRMLKAEYLFTPYKPSNAVLTGGNLEIDSSTTVTTVSGFDPTLAAIHSNGNITVANGNPTVKGPVSQSGTGALATSNNFTSNTGGTVTVTVPQSVPFVSAAEVWGRQHLSSPPGGWYDLCPDGSVHLPDGTGPCLGTQVATGSFRGWTYQSTSSNVFPSTESATPEWDATSAIKQNGYSGTYYVMNANVNNVASNSGNSVPNMTVIASSSSLSCNKVGGNIYWSQTDLAAPSIPSMFMLADQDLETTHNFFAGSNTNGTVVSGLFIAGDQIQMETSSQGAYGAVVAADECHPAPGTSLVDSNVIKNPSIYYDPNAQAPFVDIINTTLWLEFVG
jgi:hypothetical protein